MVADYTGKAQFFVAFKCPAQHEGEGDRLFDRHVTWMRRTHPTQGQLALLQYTVSKSHDDEGNVVFLLAEVYETGARIDNHRELAHGDEEASGDGALFRFAEKCQTIGWSDGGRARALVAHGAVSAPIPTSDATVPG